MATIDPKTVFVAVRDFVVALPSAPSEITDETELLVSGILDSLSIFALVAALEEKLSVTIPPADITPDTFGTPAAIAAYLCPS